MFYGNILVSHGFRLILSIYQCFIQILTDIRLTAGYFDAVVQRRLDTVQKMIFAVVARAARMRSAGAQHTWVPMRPPET